MSALPWRVSFHRSEKCLFHLQHVFCCFLIVTCGLVFSSSWKVNHMGKKYLYTALQLPMMYCTLRAKRCYFEWWVNEWMNEWMELESGTSRESMLEGWSPKWSPLDWVLSSLSILLPLPGVQRLLVEVQEAASSLDAPKHGPLSDSLPDLPLSFLTTSKSPPSMRPSRHGQVPFRNPKYSQGEQWRPPLEPGSSSRWQQHFSNLKVQMNHLGRILFKWRFSSSSSVLWTKILNLNQLPGDTGMLVQSVLHPCGDRQLQQQQLPDAPVWPGSHGVVSWSKHSEAYKLQLFPSRFARWSSACLFAGAEP